MLMLAELRNYLNSLPTTSVCWWVILDSAVEEIPGIHVDLGFQKSIAEEEDVSMNNVFFYLPTVGTCTNFGTVFFIFAMWGNFV